MKDIRIGIDTGGAFTDFVIFAGRRGLTLKLPSTPEDPSRAIRLKSKASFRVEPGDVLRIEKPGGGGYGPSPKRKRK